MEAKIVKDGEVASGFAEVKPEPTVDHPEGLLTDAEYQNIKNITQGYVGSGSKAMIALESVNKHKIPKELNKEFGNEIFVPNNEQIQFLRSIFNPKSGQSLEDWMKFAFVSEKQLREWWNTTGFSDWIGREAERRMMLYKLEWISIGVKKMHHHPETWKTMKELFFPDGVKTSPAEKGSKRYQMEQEAKRLLELKKSNAKD